jgi:hypothetical protein
MRRKVPAPFVEKKGATGVRAHRFQPIILAKLSANTPDGFSSVCGVKLRFPSLNMKNLPELA